MKNITPEDVKDFVAKKAKELNINISINVGYYGSEKNMIYGSITVGNFGFIMEGTFQPQSNTTEQFRMDAFGECYYNSTEFENGKPYQKKHIQGFYEDVLLKNIQNCIYGCISWCIDETDKKLYQKALKSSNL